MSAPGPEFLPMALFNGAITPAESLRVSPLASGFAFGEGLFETVRVHQSLPLFLQAHCGRLSASLSGMSGAPAVHAGRLYERCRQVIDANGLVAGNLKIVVFRDVTGWSEMISARRTVYDKARYDAGFRLMTCRCEVRSDPIHRLKTLNYLANILAKRRALEDGFDEPLFVDSKDRVLEGATTNMFLVKDGVVVTPPLEANILPGTMRARVLSLVDSGKALERNVTLEEAYAADEVFVTNALMGVMPISCLDSVEFDLSRNAVTRELMAKLECRISKASAGEIAEVPK